MPLTYADRFDTTIHVEEIEERQWAVIVDWPSDPKHKGAIVFRFEDRLVNHGDTRERTYWRIWKHTTENGLSFDERHRVRILPNGFILTVENNE